MAKIAIMGFPAPSAAACWRSAAANAASIARRAGEPGGSDIHSGCAGLFGSPDAALFTNSLDTILADPEVKVVVETIGGTKFAYPYVRQCLESGRSVCTSNKEHGWPPTAPNCWRWRGSTAWPSCLRPAWAAAPHHHPDAPMPGGQPYQPHPGHCERHQPTSCSPR